MAIWQFCFYLVPEQSLAKMYGEVPNEIPEYRTIGENHVVDESFEFPDFWKDVDGLDDIKAKVSKRMPKLNSWSCEAEMYGYDGGTKIEIWNDEVICFIDARNNDINTLKFCSIIADEFNCKIILKDNGKVIDASYFWLLKEFRDSIATSFTKDPKGTITNRNSKNI